MPTAEFAAEIGFSLRRIFIGEPVAIEKLAGVGHLNRDQVAELISWSGEIQGDVRMRFRDVTFVSRALRSPTMRCCPRCLRDDHTENPDRPLEEMAYRGDWQVKYQHVCLRHRQLLVPLWTATSILKRYDFQTQLGPCLPNILRDDWEGQWIEPTKFEVWLDRRLETGEDETPMAQFDFYAALEASRLLGAELLRHDPDTGENCSGIETMRQSIDRGFRVVSRGELAITETLQDMTRYATKGGHKAKHVYGMFYESLSRDLLNEPEYEPFRRLLRDVILETWPIAPGEEMLGEEVRERRLHSVRTASYEIQTKTGPLRAALVDAGIIAANDDRPDALVTFDSEKSRQFLQDYPRLVGFREMAKHIGATEHQFEALVREGILTPLVKIPGFRAPWRISDGTSFVEKLLCGAETIEKGAPGWEHIHRAAHRAKFGLKPILSAIASEKVTVGQQGSSGQYRAIFVRSADITAMIEEGRVQAETDLMSISQFARQIGLRGAEGFAALFEAGLSPTAPIVNPASGHKKHYVTQDDADTIRAQFVTLSMIASTRNLSHVTVKRDLKLSGVFPFKHEGRSFGQLYLRADVERLLVKNSGILPRT